MRGEQGRMRSERQAGAMPLQNLVGLGKECDLTLSAVEANEFLNRGVT